MTEISVYINNRSYKQLNFSSVRLKIRGISIFWSTLNYLTNHMHSNVLLPIGDVQGH